LELQSHSQILEKLIFAQLHERLLHALSESVKVFKQFQRDILTGVSVIKIGAIAMVHAKNGFNAINGGMEIQLLMLVSGLYL